jgi:tetratricopeptide (TPR) repeat protein
VLLEFLKNYKILLLLLFFYACLGSKSDFEKAVNFKKELRYKDATILFQKIIDEYPNSKEGKFSLYELANVYYELGNRRKAETFFELYLKSDSTYGYEASLKVADYNIKIEDFKKAIFYYEKALSFSSEKERSRPFLGLGLCFFYTKNFALSLEYLEKAYENAIDKQHVLFFKALAFFFNTEESVAIEEFEKCEKINQNSYYGVLCSYYKAQTLKREINDNSYLEIMTNIRDDFPNKEVIDFKLRKNVE